MNATDLAVALLEAGYVTGMTRRALRESVVVVMRTEPSELRKKISGHLNVDACPRKSRKYKNLAFHNSRMRLQLCHNSKNTITGLLTQVTAADIVT